MQHNAPNLENQKPYKPILAGSEHHGTIGTLCLTNFAKLKQNTDLTISTCSMELPLLAFTKKREGSNCSPKALLTHRTFVLSSAHSDTGSWEAVPIVYFKWLTQWMDG